ncbi:SurA N-terminal domain-containing protein [Desulfonatronum lacustre]|uniref:SurA N-terminal domain-containing protein n=1 Tax=Desulfonatronum lacustre TaxID=66849 RepID=UPI0004BCBE11|nr:SurA N-terminal domain-containing protein [Desulfonatronum lacustre]
MRYFWQLVILGAVFFLSATAGPASARDVVDRIVAVVNGDVITLFELNQRYRPFVEQFQGQDLGEAEKRMLLDAKRQLLDRMIDEVLLRQEAQRLEIAVTDLEVQTQARQLRERAGLSELQFQEQLTLQGLNREQYERRLRDEMLRHRLLGFMVRRKVVVTSDEVRAFYEANKEEFAQQRRVRLGLILFDSQTLAEEILARIQAGELSFGEAAGRYSRGPGAEQGGDMGMFAWGDLSPNWRGAVEPLRVGDVSSVVLIQDRPAVIKLLEEEAGELKTLADVEEQIREMLMEPLLDERYDIYMENLRNRALIDVRL